MPGSLRRAVIALLLAPLAAACIDEADIHVLEPAIGAMLPGGKNVTLKVEAEGESEVLIQGRSISGEDYFSATLGPLEGLGFVVAQIPGDELIAVRSYHQGWYRRPSDWHSKNLVLQLGSESLSGTGGASVATLISQLLAKEELSPFIKNPLTMKITVGPVPVPVTVKVSSAKTPKVVVSLKLQGGVLRFLAVLSDVRLAYTANASLLKSSGTATYKTVQVLGDVQLTPTLVTLSKVKTEAQGLTIKDAGGLPIGGIQALTGLLNVDIKASLGEAAARAAQTVFTHLLREIRPTVGLSFAKPITQQTDLEQVTVGAAAVALTYRTLIQAGEPTVARKDQLVLRKEMGALATPAGGHAAAYCGSGLVNAFAHAVWDAGNFDGLSFTRGQLESLGMKPLSFPYSNLERAILYKRLPPLLVWAKDGPRLEVGGLEVDVIISSSPDSRAWSAASVPVRLLPLSGQLRLVQDPTRKVSMRQVGFNQISTLADQQEVLRILQTAVPGVIKHVFNNLPAITLPNIRIKRLRGDAGPLVVPKISSVTPRSDHWQIDLQLTMGP